MVVPLIVTNVRQGAGAEEETHGCVNSGSDTTTEPLLRGKMKSLLKLLYNIPGEGGLQLWQSLLVAFGVNLCRVSP